MIISTNLVHYDAWQLQHYSKGVHSTWNVNKDPYQRGLGKTIPYTNPNIDNSVTGDIY
jgi:hypothetical protein